MLHLTSELRDTCQEDWTMGGVMYMSVDKLLTFSASISHLDCSKRKEIQTRDLGKPVPHETPFVSFAQQPIPQRTLIHLLGLRNHAPKGSLGRPHTLNFEYTWSADSETPHSVVEFVVRLRGTGDCCPSSFPASKQRRRRPVM